MMNVLIVDDEPIIRQVLRTMIQWEDYGLKWGGEAIDGLEAWERVQQGGIDLVVTDILMPRMDGLELVKRMKEAESDVAVVVLSCLDDFTYVKEAMKRGARDYILKPTMEPDQLAGILCEAKKALEERREAAIRQEQLQQQLQQSKQAQWGMRLQMAWLHGGRPDEELETVWFQEGAMLTSYMVYFTPAVCLSSSHWQWPEALAYVALSEHQQLLVYQDTAAVVDDSDFEGDKGSYSLIYREAEDVHAVLFLKATDVDPASCIVTQVRGIRSAERFDVVLKEHERLRQRFFYSHSDESMMALMAIHGEEAVYESSDTPLPQEEKQNLLRAIAGHNEPAVAYWSEQIIARLKLIQPPVEQVYFFLYELLGLAAAFAQQNAVLQRLEEWTWKEFTLADVQTHLHIDCLGDWFTANCRLMAGSSTAALLSSQNPFVRKAVAFMNRNYHLAISTTDIAEYVKLSRSYLSDLYSKETGESLIEALTRIRIEAAKHLLMTKAKKVYEIAEAVGFSDSKTFAKTFKRTTGCTPKEYEEQNRT